MTHSGAFTLIELMVVLAIMAILITVGIPGYQTFVLNNQLTAQSNDFIASLRYARSEAIKRGQHVAMCKSQADASGNRNACDGTGWEDGWIVYIDTNNNSALDFDKGEQIVRAHDALNANFTLRGNTNVATTIVYEGNGSLAGSPGTVVLCNRNEGFGPYSKAIVINNNGSERVIAHDDSTLPEGVNSCEP